MNFTIISTIKKKIKRDVIISIFGNIERESFVKKIYAEHSMGLEEGKEFKIDFGQINYELIKITNLFVPNSKFILNVYVGLGQVRLNDITYDYDVIDSCYIVLKYDEDYMKEDNIPFSYDVEWGPVD